MRELKTGPYEMRPLSEYRVRKIEPTSRKMIWNGLLVHNKIYMYGDWEVTAWSQLPTLTCMPVILPDN